MEVPRREGGVEILKTEKARFKRADILGLLPSRDDPEATAVEKQQ